MRLQYAVRLYAPHGPEIGWRDLYTINAETEAELIKIAHGIFRAKRLDAMLAPHWFPIELCTVPINSEITHYYQEFRPVTSMGKTIGIVLWWRNASVVSIADGRPDAGEDAPGLPLFQQRSSESEGVEDHPSHSQES